MYVSIMNGELLLLEDRILLEKLTFHGSNVPVNAVLWRVGIGIFNFRFFAELNKSAPPKFQRHGS